MIYHHEEYVFWKTMESRISLYCKALFFFILGLRIFFQNIKVRGGKKIKIKITTIFYFFI